MRSGVRQTAIQPPMIAPGPLLANLCPLGRARPLTGLGGIDDGQYGISMTDNGSRSAAAQPGIMQASGASIDTFFHVGITGHRTDHPAMNELGTGSGAVARALAEAIGIISAAGRSACGQRRDDAPPCHLQFRLLSMLADGTDQWAAKAALDNQDQASWEVIAPAPCGAALTAARGVHGLGSSKENVDAAIAHARSTLASSVGQPMPAPLLGHRQQSLEQQVDAYCSFFLEARRFEMSESDAELTELWLQSLEDAGPGSSDPAIRKLSRDRFEDAMSRRYALASRFIVEHSDLVIAVWDGARRVAAGGTGHTVELAISQSVPVLLIDPAYPERKVFVRDFQSLEKALKDRAAGQKPGGNWRHDLERFVGERAAPPASLAAVEPRWIKRWRVRKGYLAFLETDASEKPPSGPVTWLDMPAKWLNRNVSDLFRSIGALRSGRGGHAAEEVKITGFNEEEDVGKLLPDERRRGFLQHVLRPFKAIDVRSTRLSDAFRRGMIWNFVLAFLAIVSAVIYLPFGHGTKLGFTGVEVVILFLVLGLVALAGARRWHIRWFESRRVAEHLRHGIVLAPLGIQRPFARWPKWVDETWPEWDALRRLRTIPLWEGTMNATVLAERLSVLAKYLENQQTYHEWKARRLHDLHRGLDRAAIGFFLISFIAGLVFIGWESAVDELGETIPKIFTIVAVVFPALAATLSGIRYFGDFERFGDNSEDASRDLDAARSAVQACIDQGDALDYETASRAARLAEEALTAEIERWEALFGGKHFGVPA